MKLHGIADMPYGACNRHDAVAVAACAWGLFQRSEDYWDVATFQKQLNA